MALKAILDNLDGLSDDVKKEYKAGTGDLSGKFLLDVTPVSDFALENVKGLKSSLSKERTNGESLARQLSAFKDLDPDKSREAIKKVGEMKDWKPDDKVREQIEATTNQLVEKHKGEIAGKDTNIAALTTQLEKNMIIAAGSQAVVSNGGTKDAPKVLSPHIERSTRMRQVDGQFVVDVVDLDGNVRISPTAGSTSPMTINELVLEMKDTDAFAPMFAGSGASGSGASGGGGGGSHSAQGTIYSNDQEAIDSNTDAIASGKMVVVDPV